LAQRPDGERDAADDRGGRQLAFPRARIDLCRPAAHGCPSLRLAPSARPGDGSEMSRERLARSRAFLIDMDGTLYLDERLLPGARELLHLLDRRGLPYLFVTNNSSRRAEDYRQRLARLGIDVPGDRILTSGDATIEYLLRSTPHRSAYLVG